MTEQNEMVGRVDVKCADKAWIGVDLDGTLAIYDTWQGPLHIGEPIWPIVRRVREMIATGLRVKIFTARVCGPEDGDHDAWLRVVLPVISRFLERCGLPPDLEVTNVKDYNCIEIWDDRARQVIPNTGEFPNEIFIRKSFEKMCKHIDTLYGHRAAADHGHDTANVEVT